MKTKSDLIPDYKVSLKETTRTEAIHAFLENNANCVEVDISEYCSMNSAQSAWLNAVSRQKLNGKIRVIRRDGRVFMIREDRW